MITKKAMQEATWLSLALVIILIVAYVGGNITGLVVLNQTNQTFGILPVNETAENITIPEEIITNITNITEPIFEIPEINITENITIPEINITENITLPIILENITFKLTIKDKEKIIKELTLENKTYSYLKIILNNLVDKIEFTNLTIDKDSEFNLANITKGIIPPKGIEFKKIYAIDISNLDFDNATITTKAISSKLFKCKYFDINLEICLENWKEILNLTKSQEYSFTINKTDPGFAEGEESKIIFRIKAPVACSPPNSGDWDINGTDNIICTYQNIILNGNLYIKNNATLTLNSSNLTLNQTNNNDYLIQTQNAGNLTIYNSNITSSKDYYLYAKGFSSINITDSNITAVVPFFQGNSYNYLTNMTFKGLSCCDWAYFQAYSTNTITDSTFDAIHFSFTGSSNNTFKNVIFTNGGEIRFSGVTNSTVENSTLDVTGAGSMVSIASQGAGNITIRDFRPSSSVNYTLNSSLGMWVNFSRSNISRLSFYDYGYNKEFINSTLYIISINSGNTTIENSTITYQMIIEGGFGGNLTVRNSNLSQFAINIGAGRNVTISNLAPGSNINNEFYDYNNPASYKVNLTNTTIDTITDNVARLNSVTYLYNVTFNYLQLLSGSNATIVNSTFTGSVFFQSNATVQNSTFKGNVYFRGNSTTNFTEPISNLSSATILFDDGNPKIYGNIIMPSSIYTFESGTYVTRYYPIYINYSNRTYVPNREILISNISHPTLFIGTTDTNGFVNAYLTFGDSNYTVNYNLSVSNNSKSVGLLTNTPITLFINAPPYSLEIPNQGWQQDSSITINLSNYFNDTEDNDLNFSIQSNPQNIQITINNDTGIVTLTSNPGWYGTNYIMFNVTDGIDWTASNNITLTVTAKPIEGAPSPAPAPPAPPAPTPPPEVEVPAPPVIEIPAPPKVEIPIELQPIIDPNLQIIYSEILAIAEDYYNKLGKLTIEGYSEGNCTYIKIDSSIVKNCIEKDKPDLNINFELPKGKKPELPIKINYNLLIFLLILILLAILFFKRKKRKKKIEKLEKELIKPTKEIEKVEEFVIREEIIEKDTNEELTKIRELLKKNNYNEAKEILSKISRGGVRK